MKSGMGWACAILVALGVFLTGCVHPENSSEWQWRQYNPNYQPLPGDRDR